LICLLIISVPNSMEAGGEKGKSREKGGWKKGTSVSGGGEKSGFTSLQKHTRSDGCAERELGYG